MRMRLYLASVLACLAISMGWVAGCGHTSSPTAPRVGNVPHLAITLANNMGLAFLSAGDTETAREALDFEASRATAMSPELSQYRMIHFATHGLVDSERPELSGLVLSLVD
jgi:CHAT domain-containing protein